MACMKCGRDTPEGQYFCAPCQEGMQQYPVKPNIAIHIPSHPEAPEPVKRRRRRLFPEETIEHLRSASRWQTATIVVLLVALCVVSALLAWEWMQPKDHNVQNFGQNYTVTEDAP